jgi:hypothetical protein
LVCAPAARIAPAAISDGTSNRFISEPRGDQELDARISETATGIRPYIHPLRFILNCCIRREARSLRYASIGRGIGLAIEIDIAGPEL